MTTIASQITSLTVVYSTVYSDADQRKHQSSASLAFVWEFTGTGEFPTQRASYAENVSIWWRHHVCLRLVYKSSYRSRRKYNSQNQFALHQCLWKWKKYVQIYIQTCPYPMGSIVYNLFDFSGDVRIGLKNSMSSSLHHLHSAWPIN